MYFRRNLKLKKPTRCCFTWIAFIELNFTVAFPLIWKTWYGRFVSNSQFVSNIVHPPPPFLPGDGRGLRGA